MLDPQWQPSDSSSASPEALRLLVTGLPPPAVARKLTISLRLLEERLSTTRRALGATNPYTLGMLAIRSSLVPVTVPIDHARLDRRAAGWIQPTAVQQEILHALAAGRSYEQAAAALGRSARTIRRRFRELTAANGVDRPLPAGALFEALGWHKPPSEVTTPR